MNPNVGSPDPQVNVEPVAAPPAAETPVTSQQSDRTAAIANYAALYQAPQPPAPVVAEPVAPLQVVETIPVTPPSAEVTQMQSTIAQLQAEIEALKPKPPPADPTAVPQKAAMEQWVELMAQAKYQEADDFLFKHFAPRLQAQIQPQLVQQATEASNAERQITTFISEFERANGDLLPMKEYVAVGAERRLQIAQNDGKIKTTADFVREYQKAVTDEATELRTKLQITRGAGKDEAMTTRRQVLNATTMEPSAIQMPQSNQQTAPQSPIDYVAARLAKSRQLQGMSI